MAANWSGLVFEDGADNIGKSFFVTFVVDLVEESIDLVEIGLFLLAEFVDPFFVNNTKGVVSGL